MEQDGVQMAVAHTGHDFDFIRATPLSNELQAETVHATPVPPAAHIPHTHSLSSASVRPSISKGAADASARPRHAWRPKSGFRMEARPAATNQGGPPEGSPHTRAPRARAMPCVSAHASGAGGRSNDTTKRGVETTKSVYKGHGLNKDRFGCPQRRRPFQELGDNPAQTTVARPRLDIDAKMDKVVEALRQATHSSAGQTIHVGVQTRVNISRGIVAHARRPRGGPNS